MGDIPVGKRKGFSIMAPSFFLCLLVSLWMVPFVFLTLLAGNFWEEYPMYCVILGGVGTVSALLVFLEILFGIWKRSGYWLKYCLMLVSYAISVGGSMVLIVYIDTQTHGEFIPGSGDASLLIFAIPSVVVYAILGAFLGIVLLVVRIRNGVSIG